MFKLFGELSNLRGLGGCELYSGVLGRVLSLFVVLRRLGLGYGQWAEGSFSLMIEQV